MTLSPEAGRVLGCLVEKQLTTPQQYPLTLNALVAAAGQSTSRDPVVVLGDDQVLAAVDELRAVHLVRVVLPSHGRSVNRYRHVLDEAWGLDAARAGLLALLLLRGPQTAGELRARLARMVGGGETDVAGDLSALAEHPEALAELQPRRPGQKEDRWRQVTAAPFATGGSGGRGTEAAGGAAPPGQPVPEGPAPGDGLDGIRAELADLRREVASLAAALDELREGLGG